MPENPTYMRMPKAERMPPAPRAGEAREIARSRVMPTKIFSLASTVSLAAGVPAPPSLAELARALKNDVDLIYEWVQANIDFYALFGAHKGPLGTQIDRIGGSFDQSALMVALLRLAGYTANFIYGTIRLTKAQIEQLLGTTESTTAHPSAEILSQGGIPNTPTYDMDGLLEYIDLDHVWVQVDIGGTDYVFDPTYKTFQYTTGVDIASILDWDEDAKTALLDDAVDGATTSSSFVQNLNRANIVDHFTTYGTTLLNWIRDNAFAATMADIIGGRRIDQLSSTPVRQTSLPYQQSVIDTWESIPNEYRATYSVTGGGLETSFYTDEIYSKRLTVTFNSSIEPLLKLDGTLVDTGSAQTPTEYMPVTFEINHPFPKDQTWTQQFYVEEDAVFALGHSYGPCSQSMVDYHRQILQQNIFNGGAAGDEDVLGESLLIYFFQWTVQTGGIGAILAQLSKSTIFDYHKAGTCFYTSYSQSPRFDLTISDWWSTNTDNFDIGNNALAVSSLYASGLEGGIFQQNLPITGISTMRLLDTANTLGQKIFTGNTLTWGSISSDLAAGWDSAYVSYFNAVSNSESRVLVVNAEGDTELGEWVGGAWLEMSIGLYAMASIIAGNIAGGGTSDPLTKGQTNDGAKKIPEETKKSNPCGGCPKTCAGDPVSLFSGNCLNDHTDIVVSRGPFPYALEFARHYDSASRLVDGPLGLGWTHNLDTRIAVGSNGLRALGETSPKEAAALIAQLFVTTQLQIADFGESFSNPAHLKTMIGVISTQWLLDELFTNNAVTMTSGGNSTTFVKLVDGSYNPQFGSADTLIDNMDGTFTVKSPQQLSWNFNTDGQLATYVDPAGVTVTYDYVDGKLHTVTNGMGRTLTLTYVDDRLDTVSDGNGRSVSFTIADGNLTEFTDAEGKTTTFEYEAPGLLTAFYLPANPLIAIMLNTYDSLGRVMTQTLANQGEAQYFLAGSRAEQVDPLGNSSIMYFNSVGLPVREINALGNKTVHEYDGLNRETKTTYPELNSTERTFDNNNNVLTVTAIAKPGSGLSDIVNTFEYDEDWNKVSKATDGEGNETNFSYDPTQGTLLTITKPEIDSQIPTVQYTWTARGQMETRRDETGIVDKFLYSGDNETMDTAIRDFNDLDPGHLNLPTNFAYNTWGDIILIKDARGAITTFEFDNERRMTKRTECSPFAFVTNWIWNDNGELITLQRQTGEVDPEFQEWHWAYLVNGNVETITDPAGNELNFAYDDAARLISRTDAKDRQWQFAYDAVNRITVVTDPADNASETRTYTDNGMLATITDANSNTTEMEYDGFDRLAVKTYPDATTEEFTYNQNSQVLTLVTRKGDTIENTYDVLTRLSSRTPGSLPTQTLGYDLAGRLTTISTPVVSGDPSSGSFGFLYDSAGRLTTQIMPNSDPVTYGLDNNGNRIQLTWPDGYSVYYVFDGLNRLTDIKLYESFAPSAVHFDYDALSRRTGIVYLNGCECAYGYAINNDMTSLEHTFDGSSVAFTFGYNTVHQVTSMSVDNADYAWPGPTEYREILYGTANNLNQYPSVDEDDFGYDDNGNLTSGPFGAAYDPLNRVTQIVSGGTTVDYLNDPLNRQAQKEVDSVKTLYLTDGAQLIAEYDDSPALVNRYVPGARLDEILIKIAGATTTFFHTDRLGSTIAQTNSSGVVLNKYIYSAFGETPSLTGTIFGFTGQRYDSEIGQYNYKARYYAPAVGRFLQPDPIGYGAGDMNIYAYVGNSPTNAIDPVGLAPQDAMIPTGAGAMSGAQWRAINYNMGTADAMGRATPAILGNEINTMGNWANLVRPHGAWDYAGAEVSATRAVQASEAALAQGNINFGATGTILGYSPDVLKTAGNTDQIVTGILSGGRKIDWSWIGKTGGDRPADQAYIKLGIELGKAKLRDPYLDPEKWFKDNYPQDKFPEYYPTQCKR